jgi:hypothetical protein
MAKRHQATRRKTYGRRQHELREREQRRNGRDVLDEVLEAMGWEADDDRSISGFEMVGGQLRLATSD